MARGSNDRGSGKPEARSGGKDAPKLGAPPKLDGPPTLSAWFEEAWHGWLKPVGGLLLVAVAYFAYTGGAMREEAAGRIVLALIVGGAIFTGVEPALARFTDSRRRYLLIGFAVVWGVVAVAPLLPIVFPGRVLAETIIGATKDAAGAVVNIDGGSQGPYEVVVSGHLRGTGEVEAAYDVEFSGEGDTTDRISGELKRTYFNQRVSRRGTGSITVKQESTEKVHRITGVRGPQIKVNGEVGSEMLDDGLHLAFRRAGLSAMVSFGLGLLIFLIAVVIDYRMHPPKGERTHLAAATGFTLAFATYCAYATEGATPHNIVKPAIAGMLAGLGLGAFIGWGISAIVNSFKPRPKKMAGVKNRFAEDE